MAVQVIKALNKTRKLQVAAYVRVSTENEDQDGSYEAQTAYYENLIRKNPDWEFVGVYGDRESGTHKENRDGFSRLIQDAMDREIDLILCKSIARWARNAVDAMETLQMLTSRNVHVVFEEGGIDTRQFGTLFQISVAAAVAQNESRSISENLKWTYRNRAKQGVFKPQKGKYIGYDTDDGKFTINEDAEVVRRIFRLYAAGRSVPQIMDEIKDVKLKCGKELTKGRIRFMLKNEIYVGDKEFGKRPSRDIITGEPDENQVRRYVKDHHKGIVDRTVWNAVQERFQSKKECVE